MTQAQDETAAADEQPSEAKTIADVTERFKARLPPTSDSAKLAKAWKEAVLQQAIDSNLAVSPPPTTLVALRADLLMHVCKKLGRLVTERESEVILRLSPSGARAVHRQMKASYEDLLDDFLIQWALAGATRLGEGKFNNLTGNRVLLVSKEAVDGFTSELDRRGKKWARNRQAKEGPYLVYVETSFDLDGYLPKKRR